MVYQFQAGTAVLTPQADGAYTGAIEFTDRNGNLTSSGSKIRFAS
jgi:hypothetical protein